MAHGDLALKHNLGAASKAKYTSPKSQNKLIEVIANFITDDLAEEVRSAKFYSIMSDEVTSHGKELMPLRIRFVDKDNNIREEFVGFHFLRRITRRDISVTIVITLEKLNISVENMHLQCYDKAANMASDRCGAQKFVRKSGAALAPYMHCTSHRLNLVNVHSCGVTDVKLTLDQMKSVYLFFENNPEAVTVGYYHPTLQYCSSQEEALFDLRSTRWAERHMVYEYFYSSYASIIRTLEHIAYGLHGVDTVCRYRILLDLRV